MLKHFHCSFIIVSKKKKKDMYCWVLFVWWSPMHPRLTLSSPWSLNWPWACHLQAGLSVILLSQGQYWDGRCDHPQPTLAIFLLILPSLTIYRLQSWILHSASFSLGSLPQKFKRILLLRSFFQFYFFLTKFQNPWF